jgi:protein SCO1/2
VIRRTCWFVAGLLGAVLLAACGSSGGTGPAAHSAAHGAAGSASYSGFGLMPPQHRPTFTLTDTRGKRFAFGKVTAGHPTLLYFGYTHCPDVCPETMADVGLALRKVPASLAARTYVVFVTTDVKRDTAPVIRRWLAKFSGGSKATWVGLRGTRAQVDAAQKAAHVAVATDGGETHAAELLLYGSDNYARVSYTPGGNEQKQIAHDLPLVARSTS